MLCFRIQQSSYLIHCVLTFKEPPLTAGALTNVPPLMWKGSVCNHAFCPTSPFSDIVEFHFSSQWITRDQRSKSPLFTQQWNYSSTRPFPKGFTLPTQCKNKTPHFIVKFPNQSITSADKQVIFVGRRGNCVLEPNNLNTLQVIMCCWWVFNWRLLSGSTVFV